MKPSLHSYLIIIETGKHSASMPWSLRTYTGRRRLRERKKGRRRGEPFNMERLVL
jgi:hypothetical protein